MTTSDNGNSGALLDPQDLNPNGSDELIIPEGDQEAVMRPIGVLPWIGKTFRVYKTKEGEVRALLTHPKVSADPYLDSRFAVNLDGRARAGLFAIVAGTGVGKSYLLKGRSPLNYGEPVALAAGSTRAAVAKAIGELILQRTEGMPPPSLFIDSAKAAIYASGGNTMGGGVSAQMLEDFTQLSAICDAAGVRVFIIINPMEKLTKIDADEWAEILEAVCSGVIVPRSLNSEGIAESWGIRGRAVDPGSRLTWHDALGFINDGAEVTANSSPAANDDTNDAERALRRAARNFYTSSN